MPFCTQCGNQVADTDQYCGKCGNKQSGSGSTGASAATSATSSNFLGGISSRTAALLCYIPVVGWIPAVAVLAAPKFHDDRYARFHAFQGIYIFVIYLLIDWVVSPFLAFGFPMRHSMRSLLHAAVFVTWIYMLIRTSQQQDIHLPIVGELAERSLAEQR